MVPRAASQAQSILLNPKTPWYNCTYAIKTHLQCITLEASIVVGVYGPATAQPRHVHELYKVPALMRWFHDCQSVPHDLAMVGKTPPDALPKGWGYSFN